MQPSSVLTIHGSECPFSGGLTLSFEPFPEPDIMDDEFGREVDCPNHSWNVRVPSGSRLQESNFGLELATDSTRQLFTPNEVFSFADLQIQGFAFQGE